MDKIDVENPSTPGRTVRLDAAKYTAMRDLYLAALPSEPPGLTPAQIIDIVRPDLPDDLFPGGATAGWWGKSVQLDLEAKKVIARSTKPVRLYRL